MKKTPPSTSKILPWIPRVASRVALAEDSKKSSENPIENRSNDAREAYDTRLVSSAGLRLSKIPRKGKNPMQVSEKQDQQRVVYFFNSGESVQEP